MSTKELNTKVRDLKELQAMIDELEAEAEAITDAIKAEMQARGVNEMQADVFTVRWKEVSSSRIDTSALKKELPEVAARYTKVTTSKRFTIN